MRHGLDGHGFVVAQDEPVTITACTWSSSKWPGRAPADTVLIRCHLGAAGRDAIVSEDDEVLVKLATADLRALLGIDAGPRFVRVARWMHALPQYVVGHLDRAADIDRAESPRSQRWRLPAPRTAASESRTASRKAPRRPPAYSTL